jgi:hypothetical protein
MVEAAGVTLSFPVHQRPVEVEVEIPLGRENLILIWASV